MEGWMTPRRRSAFTLPVKYTLPREPSADPSRYLIGPCPGDHRTISKAVASEGIAGDWEAAAIAKGVFTVRLNQPQNIEAVVVSTYKRRISRLLSRSAGNTCSSYTHDKGQRQCR